jgi:chorismate mutase
MELKPFLGIREKRPFLIAGPCSAETEGQVMSIAQDLAKQGNISLFRSGIWKPRTRPGSFEMAQAGERRNGLENNRGSCQCASRI